MRGVEEAAGGACPAQSQRRSDACRSLKLDSVKTQPSSKLLPFTLIPSSPSPDFSVLPSCEFLSLSSTLPPTHPPTHSSKRRTFDICTSGLQLWEVGARKPWSSSSWQTRTSSPGRIRPPRGPDTFLYPSHPFCFPLAFELLLTLVLAFFASC